MNAEELVKLRAEMLSIREVMTTCPDASLQEVENRLDAVAATIAQLNVVESPAVTELLRDINRILGDLSALCEQAAEFYGAWIATLGSLAGEYDGTGVPSLLPLQRTRVVARG